jgi:hypothetical protein
MDKKIFIHKNYKIHSHQIYKHILYTHVNGYTLIRWASSIFGIWPCNNIFHIQDYLFIVPLPTHKHEPESLIGHPLYKGNLTPDHMSTK